VKAPTQQRPTGGWEWVGDLEVWDGEFDPADCCATFEKIPMPVSTSTHFFFYLMTTMMGLYFVAALYCAWCCGKVKPAIYRAFPEEARLLFSKYEPTMKQIRGPWVMMALWDPRLRELEGRDETVRRVNEQARLSVKWMLGSMGVIGMLFVLVIVYAAVSQPH